MTTEADTQNALFQSLTFQVAFRPFAPDPKIDQRIRDYMRRFRHPESIAAYIIGLRSPIERLHAVKRVPAEYEVAVATILLKHWRRKRRQANRRRGKEE